MTLWGEDMARHTRRIPLRLAALLAAAAAIGCTPPPTLVVLTPSHGAFVSAPSVVVSGAVLGVTVADAALTLNGAPVTLQPNGNFSVSLTLDPAIVFNPIALVATDTSNGFTFSKHISVIAGDSVADGAFSPQSIALRINDSGLEQVETIVTELVDLDPSTLLTVGQVVLDECVVFDPLFGFCLGSARVTVVNPPPTISGFGIMMDAMSGTPGFVAGDILVSDLAVNLDIDGSGLVPNCGLTITADTTDIDGDYGLSPDGVDPSTVDVDQLGGVSVGFGNFNDNLSGICDVPIIGDIIQLFLPNIQDVTTEGFMNLLDDPDGAGPLDAPIADAIEEALLAVEISGPIGQSLGVLLETPLFDIPEDDDGLTLGSDTRITSVFGTGPGECVPPPGAPDLAASYHVTESFPSLGPVAPSGRSYDLGIGISTSAFNQLLKAEIECGLLQQQLSEFDLGFGPLPLTAGLLASLIPEFGIFPPSAPVLLAITPTLAPALTGNPGPAGEIAELRVGHLRVDVLDATPGVTQPLLAAAIDFRSGLELLLDRATGQLAPTLTSLEPGDVTVALVDNLIQTDEATLGAVLPSLLAVALPQLAESLGALPLPGFLGLAMDAVEISREGEFMSIFANLSPSIVANGTMEDVADTPDDGAGWEGDAFAIAAAENGVEPFDGLAMLRFDGTEPGGAGVGPLAEVGQEIDLSAFAGEIAAGTAVFSSSAFFDRVAGDAETDTRFHLTVTALDGGGAPLASIDNALDGDADPASWERLATSLQLPTATASVDLAIVAEEDVFDDTVAPEFDGHYADNVRASVGPLVANAGMEVFADGFDDGVEWEADPFTIVGPENGVSPRSGAGMLRFDATDPAGASALGAGIASQRIDVTGFAGQIATGTASFAASYYFNRVPGDAETDTLFFITVAALDAVGLILDSASTLAVGDADVGTWQLLQTNLVLPAGTASVQIGLIAFENVMNDVVAPEFDGHYADDVSASITP